MNIRSLFVVVVASAAIAAFASPTQGTSPVQPIVVHPFPSYHPLPAAPASPAAVVMVLGAAFQAARKRFRK